MQSYNLGQYLERDHTPVEKRMGQKQYDERRRKEENMLKNSVPPAVKSKISTLFHQIAINHLLPTLYTMGRGEINRIMRAAFTDFKIQEIEIKVKNLNPKLRGLKLAHLSDLHLDLKESFPSALRRFIAKNKSILNNCELVLITGDFQDKYLNPTCKTIEGFSKICPEIQPPIVGVLGNHDRLEIAQQIEAIPSQNGIKILLNESLKIKTANGGSLTIQGIDDPHYYKTHKLEKNVDQNLGILLSHSPEVYKEAQKHRFNLCLSGHTHGGQIRLPALGAIVKAAKVPRDLLQGPWQYKDLAGHTSPGLGCSGLSIRLLCPPEISIITLK